MYILKTSKEFAALHLTVNEVIKGLNKYFDGPSIDNVRFYDAKMDYTYYYSPKCCLSAAILWLHEQGVDYFCGMTLPCEEEKEKVSPVKARNVLSADIKIEPDALPELTVKIALWDGTFDSVLINSICEDLIQYISKYGEDADAQEDKADDDLYEHEFELLDLKKKIVLALGIPLSDRKIAIDDHSKLHDFSYLIKLIECQTCSYENTSTLLNKANARCTKLETLKEDICKTMTIPSNTADINVVREVGGLKRKLMDAKEDLDKLNEKYYDLQHRYDITYDAFVERNTFRDEVYKILNVNRETWSDSDIYSTLKIQKERADLYTRRENLEEKVPSMIKELYDLIRTPYSDKRLNQDTEDPCYNMGVVTQQMFDILKEYIPAHKNNEDILLKRLSRISKASSEAIDTLSEALY